MNKSTYFISDLHLDESRPHLFKLFYEFIDAIKGEGKNKAEALYILGDLFEFWIGDDIIDLPIGKPYLPIIEKLKSLSDSGTKIYFTQGNRDFLIGDTFMQRIGGTLLPDEKVIDLYGMPAVVLHGDTLCTDDKSYQRMRWLFRLTLVQKLYLAMRPQKRAEKAGQVRGKTSEITKQKPAMILDVNQQAVVELARTRGVCLIIHGHTHRPAEHEFSCDAHPPTLREFKKLKPAKRIVLGDWHDKACYLRVNGTEFELVY